MAIYFIKNEATGNVTIGRVVDVRRKLKQLQASTGVPLSTIATLQGIDDKDVQLKAEWELYRIGHSDWFSINVSKKDGEVRITGNKKQREVNVRYDPCLSEGPYENQLCLRFNNRQLALLDAYVDNKSFESRTAAVRFMVNGLEGWLKQHSEQTELSSPQLTYKSEQQTLTSPPPVPVLQVSAREGRHSGLPTITDEDLTDEEITTDEDETGDSPVGDFAGRPSIALPGSNYDDMG